MFFKIEALFQLYRSAPKSRKPLQLYHQYVIKTQLLSSTKLECSLLSSTQPILLNLTLHNCTIPYQLNLLSFTKLSPINCTTPFHLEPTVLHEVNVIKLYHLNSTPLHLYIYLYTCYRNSTVLYSTLLY